MMPIGWREFHTIFWSVENSEEVLSFFSSEFVCEFLFLKFPKAQQLT